jgi:hypothetical protein
MVEGPDKYPLPCDAADAHRAYQTYVENCCSPAIEIAVLELLAKGEK